MKNKKVKVAAIQLSSALGNKKQNIEKVEFLIGKYIQKETDIVVLPEVWTVGWACKYFKESAESLVDGTVTKFLSKTAKKYNINIIGGSYITEQNGKLYNTCPVINRKGELVAHYNKCHLFSYYGDNEGDMVTAGNHPVIVDIEGIRTGLSICYDIRFPELYRAYVHKGVDLMVNVAAWGIKKEIPWVSMTHSRAVENQCYFVALTQSGAILNGDYNLGKSAIIDYKGENLAEINDGEGAITAELNVEEEYEFRQKCTILKNVLKEYNVKEY